MIEVVVREGLDSDIDKLDLQNILKVFVDHLFGGERSLSLYLTDDDEIRQFNLKQRGMDQPTDILSWSYFEEDPEVEWIGDLMLSLPRVKQQAHENGWDHERSEQEALEMLKCETEMLEKIGFEKIYTE